MVQSNGEAKFRGIASPKQWTEFQIMSFNLNRFSNSYYIAENWKNNSKAWVCL